MNLQTIQKRIEELQAELLTISNDLAFLINGDVTRQPTQLVGLTDFTQLRVGDVVEFEFPFTNINGETTPAGRHTVMDIEEAGYDGCWSVVVGTGWVNFNVIAKGQLITKVEA